MSSSIVWLHVQPHNAASVMNS